MNFPFLKKYDSNFQKFFEWTLDYLCHHKKTITVVNARNVDFGDSKCSGWCDGENITIASKNPLFAQVYCHEFAHMTQYVEQSDLWKDEYDFWKHLEENKLSPKNWSDVMQVIALERDCEKRALAFSKKWNLFDSEKYAQQANLYLHYYQYIFLVQKWIDTTSIYHPILLEKMPKTIKPLSYFNSIDMELMALFDECLNKKGKFYKKGFTWNKIQS